MSRRSYLPDDLPHNRALWPEEYRELEQLDLLASRLIRQLKNQKYIERECWWKLKSCLRYIGSF